VIGHAVQAARRALRYLGGGSEPHPRPLRRRAKSLAVPFAFPAPAGDAQGLPPLLPRRAVIAHLFHTELAEEFLGYFSNIPGEVDLYLSTDTAAKAERLGPVFSAWKRGTVTVEVIPNVGRDMASKFVTFADRYARYDILLFVHSKKSVYLDGGHDWRAMLLQTLCGSPETIASVLHIFAREAGIGMVFPEHFPGIVDRLSWGGNRLSAGALAERAGIALDRARGFEFVSGSMFWARPAALAPLLTLGLRYEDFPPEEGQLDATLAHALERLLLYSAETAGFDWIKIADPRYYPPSRDIIPVHDEDELRAAIARCRTRLIAGP
jgi:lipopolysaccharide biosynthesis protein